MSGFAGYAIDQTRIWTLVLANYVFMVGAIFGISDRDGACPSYYIYNARLDHIGGSLLFRLPSKIFHALNDFGMYKFAILMRTDSVLTALAFHRFEEVDYEKTVVKARFFLMNFALVKSMVFARR